MSMETTSARGQDNPQEPGRWVTASSQGACVEVRRTADGIEMRDTKGGDTPENPILSFDPETWATFLGQVTAGEFDMDSLARLYQPNDV